MTPFRVYVGWDPREQDAYSVAERSLRKHSSISVDVQPLVLEHLGWRGFYSRPTSTKAGRLFDDISQAEMATEFALSRFLVPVLNDFKGWALFCDCDMLFRADIAQLVAMADPQYAVMCVPHLYVAASDMKMDGQKQLPYSRKNWSSFVLFNCEHLAHAGQQDRVNRWPGLWLHQFRWLQQEQIGALPWEWNELDTGEPPPREPKVYHFTRGVPSMPGYESVPFADEWRSYL